MMAGHHELEDDLLEPLHQDQSSLNTTTTAAGSEAMLFHSCCTKSIVTFNLVTVLMHVRQPRQDWIIPRLQHNIEYKSDPCQDTYDSRLVCSAADAAAAVAVTATAAACCSSQELHFLHFPLF